MLIVISIIGILAAVSIPSIGSMNQASKGAAAHRNAQTIATIINAAIAAGVDPSGWVITQGSDLVNYAEGLSDPVDPLPDLVATDGAFEGKTFTIGDMAVADELAAGALLSWDAANKVASYNPDQ